MSSACALLGRISHCMFITLLSSAKLVLLRLTQDQGNDFHPNTIILVAENIHSQVTTDVFECSPEAALPPSASSLLTRQPILKLLFSWLSLKASSRSSVFRWYLVYSQTPPTRGGGGNCSNICSFLNKK